MQFNSFVPAWNEGMYAQTDSFLFIVDATGSDGAAHIIIRLELPSEDRDPKR